MKFFTKEWYLNSVASLICFDLKKSNKAQKFNEKYYNSLYSSQEKWFLKNRKLLAKQTHTEFDEEKTKLDFSNQCKENLDFVKASFPESLWSSMPDERLLALGTADSDTLAAITHYCGELSKKCDKAQREYEDSCEILAEKIGWYPINSLEKLVNSPICSLDTDGSTVTIKTSPENTDLACKVVLSVAKITSTDNVFSAYILYPEILEDGDRFVLNLLCEGENKELLEFSAEFQGIEIEDI